jgi:hypothetical protein
MRERAIEEKDSAGQMTFMSRPEIVGADSFDNIARRRRNKVTEIMRIKIPTNDATRRLMSTVVSPLNGTISVPYRRIIGSESASLHPENTECIQWFLKPITFLQQ